MSRIKSPVVLVVMALLFAGFSAKAFAQCTDFSECTIYEGNSVVSGDAYIHGVLQVGPSNETYISYQGIGADVGSFYTLNAINKNFKIDHPSDPANKYLYHSSVESPDMKTIYDGVARLDATGAAWVQLPSWFGDLNGDFRYQLTSIGKSGAGLYIAEEVSNNRFKIAGGPVDLKVSWQVTGIRHDPSARKSRHPLEEEKSVADRGRYLDPAAFGQPLTSRILLANPPPMPARLARVQTPKTAESQAKSSQAVMPIALAFGGVFGAGLFVNRRRNRR